MTEKWKRQWRTKWVLWVECAVRESVQADVVTSVKTPFCLRLKGLAEVYADAKMTL